MGKQYRNLFDSIVDINNIRNAYYKVAKGKNRYTSSHLNFKENLEQNLFNIQQHLKNDTYSVGDYFSFFVYEPKKRIIHSLPFKDRVVQHSINNIIAPIFEKTFFSCSYACRENKGTHKGAKAVQSNIRRLREDGEVYYLKMDFRKYFASINSEILKKEIMRKISDKRTLKLLFLFINPKGIPIGNLLSQLYANIYGHIFDRHIKTIIKAKYYTRYMDDTIIISNNKEELRDIKDSLELFAKNEMKLEFSKWSISNISTPLNFLGYRISANYKLIRRDSIKRAKRKIKKYIMQNDNEKLELFLASWYGHIKIADSHNLKQFIIKEMENARNKQKTTSRNTKQTTKH